MSPTGSTGLPSIRRTAVLTVDLQHEFFDNASALGNAIKLVCMDGVTRLLAEARARQWTVMHAITKHNADGSTLPYRLRQLGAGAFCVDGTSGSELLRDVHEPGDEIFEKTSFTALTNDALLRRLQDHDQVIICGTSVDCVVGDADEAIRPRVCVERGV